MGEGNDHAAEYQLYFMNLRANATVRSPAWVAPMGHAPQPN